MDRWCEVVSGSNVWYSVRDLYDVVVLCIANRSVDDALVEVDYHGSTNVEVFGRLSSSSTEPIETVHADPGTVRIAVPGCTTRACLTLYATDPLAPPKLRLVCSLVVRPQLGGREGISMHRQESTDRDHTLELVHVDGTTADVERQSKHVERVSVLY